MIFEGTEGNVMIGACIISEEGKKYPQNSWRKTWKENTYLKT
jgi:hypothetical protein